ncbi:hypothetical protein SYNGFB01_01190 [Synechococcus sp. GFB01]|nr:hypothetical protein SYNGFB01_01190 [Synechococcus sp. GFB01]
MLPLRCQSLRGVLLRSLGDGIDMVKALDAAHAADITQTRSPGARLSVVPATAIEGMHRQRLLMRWLDTL